MGDSWHATPLCKLRPPPRARSVRGAAARDGQCRRICFLRAGGPRRVKATAHDEKDDEIAKRREANIARKEAQRQRREQARSGTANGARSSQERDGLQKRAGTSHAREHVG